MEFLRYVRARRKLPSLNLRIGPSYRYHLLKNSNPSSGVSSIFSRSSVLTDSKRSALFFPTYGAFYRTISRPPAYLRNVRASQYLSFKNSLNQRPTGRVRKFTPVGVALWVLISLKIPTRKFYFSFYSAIIMWRRLRKLSKGVCNTTIVILFWNYVSLQLIKYFAHLVMYVNI